MNFYKSVIEHRGKLLVRGIHGGKDYKEKLDFGPTLYALTQQETEYKNLQGQYLKPITFKNILPTYAIHSHQLIKYLLLLYYLLYSGYTLNYYFHYFLHLKR